MARDVKRPLQSSYPVTVAPKFRRWHATRGRKAMKAFNPRLYLFPVPLSAAITTLAIFSQSHATPGQPLATGRYRR